MQWRMATITTRVQFAPLRLAGGFALEGRGGFVVERIDCC